MKTTSNNLPFPKSNGMTVPEGYFKDFQRRIMDSLSELPVAEPEKPRTKWQIIRPYVYMAAMFAGVYLMMNMFSLTGIFNHSEQSYYAEVVNEQTLAYIDDYVSVNDIDFYDDLYEAGITLPESL